MHKTRGLSNQTFYKMSLLVFWVLMCSIRTQKTNIDILTHQPRALLQDNMLKGNGGEPQNVGKNS
jgi:hypothetical protein